MSRRWIVFLLLAVLAAGAAGLLSQRRAVPERQEAPVVASDIAAEGKVEAMPGYDIDVGSGELNGRIDSILVEEGEKVQAGQVVAVLWNDELKAAVDRARSEVQVARSRLAEVRAGARTEEIGEATAAWEGAQATEREAAAQLQRYRELRAQGMVSSAALDERMRIHQAARAATEQSDQRRRLLEAGARPETIRLYADQVRLAEAALAYAERLLERTYIRSPIAGTVIQRYLDKGEGVTPEIPILAIADPDHMWVNVEVDEADSGKVNPGDPVEVTSDAFRGTKFAGRVRKISEYAGVRKIRPSNPAVNLGQKVVQVKIELAQKTPLKLGMTVDVRIARAADARPPAATTR